MQLIIRRELRGGNLLKYDKAFSEEKVVYDKTKVCFVCCFYIFQFSCFCIILDFWFVTSCVMYKNSITKELLMYFFPFILFQLMKKLLLLFMITLLLMAFLLFELLVCMAVWMVFMFFTNVATLALGSRPRQRGCKGAGQEEARESHQRLPGVQESVRE